MELQQKEKKKLKQKWIAKFSPEEVEKVWAKILRKKASNVTLPGFRKGKAPLEMVEAKFKAEIESDTLQRLAEMAVTELKDKHGLKIAGKAVYKTVPLEKNKEIEIPIEFETYPELELSKEDYMGIKLKIKTPKIEPERIEQEIKNKQAELTRLVPAEKVEPGFVVTISYRILENGKVLTDQKNVRIRVEADTLLGKAIEGKSTGKGKEELTVANKKYTVEYEIKEIKKPIVPEVNDEFAKEAGFKSLEDMKKKIEELLINERKQEMLEDALTDYINKKFKFPVPEELLASKFDELLYLTKNLIESYGTKWEDFVKEKGEEKIEKEIRQTAERLLREEIFLSEVSRLEDIKLTPEEVASDINRRSRLAGVDPETYVKRIGSGLKDIIFDALLRKTKKFIIENAKIEEG